jgi:hypothetical protein
MRLVPGDLTDGYKISPPVVSHFSSFLFFRFFSHFIPFHISSRTQSAHKFHKNRKFTTHYLHNHITNISHITYSQENTKKHRNAHHKFTRKFDKKPSRRRRAPTPAVKCAAAEVSLHSRRGASPPASHTPAGERATAACHQAHAPPRSPCALPGLLASRAWVASACPIGV